ncbi:MAG: SUMF1/EgtB/PvdO family nonheme iron enzyme [Magnetococcales bacterium]|nr:SUMF1/EgtB/PvdO family nonheme iron enzyme [Magnetococcales bacterium]
MEIGSTLLNRYIIEQHLGNGLFGDAFRARDEVSGLSVVLKTVPEQICDSALAMNDLRSSLKLLQAVDHPNVVKTHSLEYDAEQNQNFLVREHVDGISLSDYRMTRTDYKLPFKEAIDICRKIADVLDHTHHFILHRELKPENVLITPSGEIKILNFCLISEPLAKEIRFSHLKRGKQSASRLHGYMAPEQFFGFPPPGPAADRYGLAVLFYELVSGRPPFVQSDPQSLMHAVCNLVPPEIFGLPARCHEVLTRGLSKDPSKRYLSAKSFVDALDHPPFFSPIESPLRVLLFLGGLAIFVSLILSIFLAYPVQKPGFPVSFYAKSDQPAADSLLTDDPQINLPVTDILADIPERQPPPPAANLMVESRPSGASVLLNGRDVGVTPLTLEQVMFGQYVLKLEKSDYSSIEVALNLQEDTVVDLNLEPQPISRKSSRPTNQMVLPVQQPPTRKPVDVVDQKRQPPLPSIAPVSVLMATPVPKSRPVEQARDAQVVGLEVAAKLAEIQPDVWVEPISTIAFITVPGGCFDMGSQNGHSDEQPVHRVCLDRFGMGQYEVTQGQWKRIMGNQNNPSRFKRGENYPVDSVSWDEATQYVRQLEKRGVSGVRLPTEAEWEYACRAGGHQDYQSGLTIDSNQANFKGQGGKNSGSAALDRQGTLPVGSFTANAFGLYDLHGNLYEWLVDRYEKDFYSRSPEKNPLGRDERSYLRVLRGGAWYSQPDQLRCSYRYRSRPSGQNPGYGIRLVVSPR